MSTFVLVVDASGLGAKHFDLARDKQLLQISLHAYPDRLVRAVRNIKRSKWKIDSESEIRNTNATTARTHTHTHVYKWERCCLSSWMQMRYISETWSKKIADICSHFPPHLTYRGH